MKGGGADGDRGNGAGEIDTAAFAKQGWLSLERVTTAGELHWLRGVYDDLFAARAGEAGEFFDLAGPPGGAGRESLPQIMEPQTKVPQLSDTRFLRTARLVAARVLGTAENELSHFSHMILKPASFGGETPWHQDEAYWDPGFDYDSVSVWMPLDDATVESGCMRFLPGSHRGPVLPHRRIGDDPAAHGLVADDIDESRAVACPVPAGCASVHHCRMVHQAGPNLTDRPRRAYIHVFAVRPRPRAEPYPRPWLAGRRSVSPGVPA